jgi:hypothetical protein
VNQYSVATELETDEFTTKEDRGRDLVAKVALARLARSERDRSSESVPALSNAGLDEVARKFGLDVSRDIYQLKTFSVPCLALPPSFHREVMRNSAPWLDVYQEPGSHSRGGPRVRLMDAVCWMRSFRRLGLI